MHPPRPPSLPPAHGSHWPTVVVALAFVMLQFLIVSGPGLASSASGGDATVAAQDARALENDAHLSLNCRAPVEACRLAHEAATDMPFPWWLLGFEVEVVPRDGWKLGETVGDEQLIRLYVDEDQTARSIGHVFAHEIGHALQADCKQALLEEWRDRRALPDDVPATVEPPHEFDSVSEDYAEAFAQYLGYGPSRSAYAEGLDQRWLQSNADLLHLGACAMLPGAEED